MPLFWIDFSAFILLLISYRTSENVYQDFLKPFLSLIYYLATPKEKFSKSIFAAIIFGFLGDVILLGDNYFPLILLGIIFFFFGHLLYTINFVLETGLRNYKKYFLFFIIISLFYSAYSKFCLNNLK